MFICFNVTLLLINSLRYGRGVRQCRDFTLKGPIPSILVVLFTDGAIIQYKYLNRLYFDCTTKMCLDRQGKYIFTQESFCLQGILNDINEQDTSFLTVNTST